MTLPLHIFEPRYRLMIGAALRGHRRFGVVLIKEGSEVGEPAQPHGVGTVARIVDATPLGDGRLNISTVGTTRFRITRCTQQHPYLLGDVEWLPEPHGEAAVAARLAQQVRAAFGQYVGLLRALAGQGEIDLDLPADPAALAYFIAPLLQVRRAEQQALLEMETAADRLREELALLRREHAFLKLLLARGERSREVRSHFSVN